MLFNSYLFILFFLPICIGGYFTLNHFKKYNLGQAYLFVMSMWFYGYYNVSYLFIILSSILINYAFYMMIGKCRDREQKGRAKALMILGVLINCGILMYFKYMDFFIENINSLAGTDYALWHIALPLGISFFTFQQISFVVDSYKGEVPKYDLLKYACFVSYFPQLIAGPIVTHDELVPQFEDTSKKQLNMDNLAKGIYMFTLGLSKKVLLADIFNDAVVHGFATIDTLTTQGAWLTMLAYSLQMYFDFSGYCDMAIGIGKMMNIDLPLNFDSPYKAPNISAFWSHWHITLSRFLTKYIYIPLGGSRRGELRTYLNIFIIFLVSGFWHGSNWTFVIWGIMNGVASMLYRFTRKLYDHVPRWIGAVLTYLFFSISMVFFRAESIGDAVKVLGRVFIPHGGPFDEMFTEIFRTFEIRKVLSVIHLEARFPHIIMIAYFVVAFYLIWISKNAYEKMQNFRPSVIKLLTTGFLFLWCVLSLSGLTVFLYFNF